MKTHWRTAWQGQEIVVYREEQAVDRLGAQDIRRVVFVHQGTGDSPGDLLYAIVETADEVLVFPDYTGFAGRVHFERQAFWAERACVYWVSERHATLPAPLRRGRWPLRHAGPAYARVPRAELAGLLDAWPLEGPQTWEQRKWRRIEDSRPFSHSAPGPLRA